MAFSGKKKVEKKFSRRTAKSSECRCLDEGKLNQMIRERAYYIWEEKGKPEGSDCDIWFQAEKDIRAKV